ncbi:SDR family oxidoreductase [Longimicrobium sp.]|uniref:SDR family oxidoreductase n=1 Tax=Longimicrobium sp. TaxID=2029185 RepID=UPI0039C9A7C3
MTELRARGYRVRALVRDPARSVGAADETVRSDLLDPPSLAAACAGADVVFSCAGASMSLSSLRDRRGPLEVDWGGNRNLLAAARGAGARKFVYVSVFGARGMRGLEYADAHERIADELKTSGMDHAIIRPTGFFSFFGEIAKMAKQGRGIVIGTGEAYTNPIHEADLAEVCAAAVAGDAREISVGGPDVMTRAQIVELAFRAFGREPRLTRVPPAIFRASATVMRPFNRRMAALLAFGAAVSQVDCVAPSYGRRRLDDFFRTFAD